MGKQVFGGELPVARGASPGRESHPATVDRLRDDPFAAWRFGHVLRSWRAADQVLRRSEPSAAQRDYEAAVAFGLAELRRFDSVPELLEHHATDRHRRVSDSGEPPVGTVEWWREIACRAAAPDAPLERSLVEEAAFWRRTCEVVGAS